jgi:hypothetical protein
MPEDCPVESKQHMINLVQEFRAILADIPNLKSFVDKRNAAIRMSEIREEMVEFRRKYPDA